ncbi:MULTISPECIES: hypothetical protein [unclassified Cytobacillus]|uniref:hypothetical protein n=1 Tax=unclassified Cytobacillus TaxID=2675268 RepID=UPI00203DAFDE|nr:hypothetical protein [Cytobacillus sp. AMY 15.2]MCM3090869.1 hypothetical protein [Cytobacillus sp. AMY 15.2]
MKKDRGRFDYYWAVVISVIAIFIMIRNMLADIGFFSVTNALAVFALIGSLAHIYKLTMSSQEG